MTLESICRFDPLTLCPDSWQGTDFDETPGFTPCPGFNGVPAWVETFLSQASRGNTITTPAAQPKFVDFTLSAHVIPTGDFPSDVLASKRLDHRLLVLP